MLAFLLIAQLVSIAVAHSPHDDVRALAVVNGQLVADEDTRLVRSTDSGETLLHSDSPGGVPACIAPQAGAPGAFILVTDLPAAFLTVDAGATWTRLDLDAPSGCAPGLTGALVSTEYGVVEVAGVGGREFSPLVSLDAPQVVTDLVETPSGTLLALSPLGELLRGDATAWTRLDPGPFTALASGPSASGAPVLLRGSPMGIELSTDDAESWRFVSDVPADVLGVGPTAWMAATIEEGVWLSRDEGDTWEQLAVGLEPVSTGSGAPAAGVRHWFTLLNDGDTLWAAAWEGLFRLRPGETWWREIETRSLPLTRDVSWLDDSLLTAPYGGGVARGQPGESGWVDAAPMLAWPWLRTALPTEGGAGRWYLVGGQHLYATDDQGLHVSLVLTGNELDGDAVAVAPGWPEDPRVWESGTNGQQAIVMESLDGGATWSGVELDGCTEKATAIVTGSSGVSVACQAGVWQRDDAGWSPVPTPGGDILSLLSDDEGALAGTAAGLWRLAPDTEPVSLYTPGPIDALARAPDGTVYAGTAAGMVHLQTDGTATALGWPEDDVVVALSVATDGRIAAGTYGGAFISEAAGSTWTLATDWDRYDDDDTAFVYVSGDWLQAQTSARETSVMKAGGKHSGTAGATLSWRVDAAQPSLIGKGTAELEITVDGGAAERVSIAATDAVTFWTTALKPGFHEIGLTVVSGTLEFDGGERWRESTGNAPSMPAKETPADPECGCAGAPGDSASTVLVVGSLAGLGSRRKRRLTR